MPPTFREGKAAQGMYLEGVRFKTEKIPPIFPIYRNKEPIRAKLKHEVGPMTVVCYLLQPRKKVRRAIESEGFIRLELEKEGGKEYKKPMKESKET